MVSPKSSYFKPEKSFLAGFAYLLDMISGVWENQYQLYAQHIELNCFQRSSRRGRWSAGALK